MDTGDHPDPFRDAMSHAMQRAVQVVSSAVTGAQAYAYMSRTHARANAERDQWVRRALDAEHRAERDAARAEWARALDRRWIRQADLLQTARAWGAAMPYADPSAPWHEPEAAVAMRACEERLRELHPTAMAHYDRLRREGMAPAEAMREAAFLFAGPARAHDSPYMPRPMLGAGNGQAPTWTTPASNRDPRAARPWEQDFPVPIDEVVANAASAVRATAASSAPAPDPGRSLTRGPGRISPRL